MKIKPELNYIALKEDELDSPIYRTMSFERFIDVFQNKSLTLVQTKKWDDPFENYLLQGEYRHGEHKFTIGFRNKYYGQCWTLNEETDAMWRIYSPNKDGVKLKTTIRKLFCSLFNTRHNESFNDRECFIGQVIYGSEEELQEAFLKLNNNPDSFFTDSTMATQTTSLFIKRNAFKHEKEIRIVFYDIQDENIKDGVRQELFRYVINPEILFEEIVFDPRMSKDMYDFISKDLKEKLQCNLPVKQSTLYRPPVFN